jgi:murein tripeptide amidase MpaA
MNVMKNLIIIGVVLILIGIGAYLFIQNSSDTVRVDNDQTVTEKPVVTTPTSTTGDVPVTEEEEEQTNAKETVIGNSVEERALTAYHYGTGETELLFVGGIHGGYSWNTVLVAYELMDYLEANPSAIPAGVRVTVIPVLNPDGLAKTVQSDGRFTKADVPTAEATLVAGRFNAHTVDLNRNFDCDWQSAGTWQSKTVSGGSKVFSEPESQALRDYVESHDITAAVVWYSAAGGVYASNCHNGVLPETTTLTNLFAKASGYAAYNSFDFYELTGDMVNWLAKNDIPAISVLLTNHKDVEWDKNKAGVEAILKHYAQ